MLEGTKKSFLVICSTIFCGCTARFVSGLFENHMVGFLMRRLVCQMRARFTKNERRHWFRQNLLRHYRSYQATAGNVFKGNRKVMQSESSREFPNMNYGIRQNVNSQVIFHELHFSQYCRFIYTKRRIPFYLEFKSASETNEWGTQTSIDYLQYTFSCVWCFGVIRFRGCKC